jgi:arsenate reductase (thioredoxin)
MRRTKLEKNILFLCEDNACLSLMAESMAKHMSPPKIRVFSAGIRPGRIPPEVRRVLQEIGVELSGSSTKSVDQVPSKDIDLVVSFGDASEQCSSLPSKAKVEKWSIPNPMRASGESSAVLSAYRHGRDEIDKRVAALFLDHWRHAS